MKKTEWFRRTTWTAKDQKEFRDRPGRCRGKYGKPQYVRIQAGYLAEAGQTQASLELFCLISLSPKHSGRFSSPTV